MFLEELFNLLAVKLELLAQGTEQLAQAHGQLTLGQNNGLGGLELVGLSEKLQALFSCCWSPQPVGVQELLPPPLALADHGVRCRKSQHDLTGARVCPAVEGFQRSGVLFTKGLLALIDPRRALLDQNEF